MGVIGAFRVTDWGPNPPGRYMMVREGFRVYGG